jgi:Fe2+ transport system protein FeoA
MSSTALSDAKIGTTGTVDSIDLPEEISHYLAHLGFLPGIRVEVLRHAPAGDPASTALTALKLASATKPPATSSSAPTPP